jgi:Uma2 family endonuclease
MALTKQFTTAEEFDKFILQPEMEDRIFELIAGEIVEVPSNPFASAIAGTILFFIKLFIRQNTIAGHVTGADGGYWVAGERYAPDVAFISKARQPELARKGYNPNPPELAVEVISDESSAAELRDLRLKITNCLSVKTVVWVVYPVSQIVEIHAPGRAVKIIHSDGTLEGGEVLPGFKVALRDISEQATE